ncbi:MAG: AAA family ATPase [Oscillospiraceae bacterium]|nr:AAA family ATPase [Oscillospiraceae bacterium]
MTRKTLELINRLSQLVDTNKYLILSGGIGVGKTFLASAVAENCALSQYNAQGKLAFGLEKYEVETEIVPIHPSRSYEDFVAGISIRTDDGKATFRHEDKVFMTMLRKAEKSWSVGEFKKYFLILDDINRGDLSTLMGDTLSLIEPHGNPQRCIPPNMYIIATRNDTVQSVEYGNYGFLRHFYEYQLENDYKYMADDPTGVYSDFDISAEALYYRARRIVLENLRDKFSASNRERMKYVLGHGMFKSAAPTLVVKHQVIPTLYQYEKDCVLSRSARISIASLQKLVEGGYSKDHGLAYTDRLLVRKSGVTASVFCSEVLTHQPMVNLVTRIKEQGLLDDADIADQILFNPQVVVRIKAKLDGEERTFPIPGCLYVERRSRGMYTYGKTKDGKGNPKRPRYFYSGNANDVVVLDGVEYTIASEMQPKEYTRWYEDLDTGTEGNERYSSSPNSIMFRILRQYYKTLEKRYDEYLLIFPGDENISRLKAYVQQEYRNLVEETRQLHPEISDEADVNERANVAFRDVIGRLTLFWKNRGETITVGGQTITVEGVYKVDTVSKYREYSQAMEKLNIHQMIMQGPPGTSKTYSAREYLKYIGRHSEADAMLTDVELDERQIKDYSSDEVLTAWEESNPGAAPAIVWDVVQFHPSYGYEDFVRGIEVSTVPVDGGTSSVISYDTTNKILGKIAAKAALPRYQNTKFFLVIDEINRANLATVFGELIYGLEYRNKGVATPYTVGSSNKVLLPNNLYIIGTMNTADKSIGGIDYAIRRRFLFFQVLPNRDVILHYNLDGLSGEAQTQQKAVNNRAVALFDRIAELFNDANLNTEFYKDDVQIGHTYFLVSSEDQLFLRFKYQMLPILREYYKDGMFQFETPDTDDDGWSGLIGCITGDVDANSDEAKLRDIFNKLIETT